MKFLHLSDLHIGKAVNNVSMLAEQAYFFNQVIAVVKAARPGAVIIAGDIYDRAVPGVEAVRVFDDFLTELCGCGVSVFIISGNHDSPERLDFASRLLSGNRLFLYGAFDGSMKKIILNDEYGEINFWMLPFIKPASLRGRLTFFNDDASDESDCESFDAAVRAVINSSDIDYGARNIIISHQYYTKPGVTAVRSDSESNPIGGLDAVDAGIIEKFDYCALGHLHGAQAVGRGNIFYGGSPIKYSVSECNHKKTIALVELKNKNELTIEKIPTAPIHELRAVRGRFNDILAEADKLSPPADKNDYLYVYYTDEEEIADPYARMRAAYPNLMHIRREGEFGINLTSEDYADIANENAAQKISPYELFCDFFAEAAGNTMNERQAAIIRGLFGDEI